MPIRPDLRRFYTSCAGWPEKRVQALRRARNRCEVCRKPNGAAVLTCCGNGRMFWMLAMGGRWRDQRGKLYRRLTPPWLRHGIRGPHAITVQLHVAHRNHVSGEDQPENLAVWCQWHHLNHDRMHHRETRCIRKDRQRPLLALGEVA